ncbi:MAG: efflux RND transporter periplasmic adaptor subunit [Gammaproteobacteria bacterium]|nr:efflux RND transporter periplasmic adaptor subunit [Gammaproteobacteria bacterium]
MWKKPAILLAILVVPLLFAWQYLKQAPSVKVSLVQPVVQSLSTKLDLNAVVINGQIVTITALVDGEIGQINAREGISVKNAQALAVLDDKKAQSLLDKARAELVYSEQKLKSTARNYARLSDLSQAGNASKQSVDDSYDAFRNAEAELAVAKADVSLAELQFENSTVSAPFDGVVTKQFAETGQWVEAGTPLFQLAASDGYLIEAQVDASDWALVSIDQSVTLTTESAPGKTWESAVSWIAPTIAINDRDAKAVAIRFAFGDDAPPLLLGQEINAELVLNKVDNVATLPLSAMVETEPNQYAVFLAHQNKAKLTPVKVGLLNEMHAQITDGLTADDAVLVSQQIRLQDNMPVEIQ